MKYHSEHLKNNRADPIDIEILSANLTTLPTSGSIITSYKYLPPGNDRCVYVRTPEVQPHRRIPV